MTSTRSSNPGGLAWLMFALAVVFCVGGLALTFSGLTEESGIEKIRIEDGIDAVAFLAFPLVGALLVSRRRNPLGWIFLAVGLFFQLGSFMGEFSYRMFAEQGSSLGTRLTGLFAVATFLVPLGLAVIFLPLLFPNGRLASPWLRPVAWVAAVALALNVLSTALLPGPLDEDRPAVTNPIGIVQVADRAQAIVRARESGLEQDGWVARSTGGGARARRGDRFFRQVQRRSLHP